MDEGDQLLALCLSFFPSFFLFSSLFPLPYTLFTTLPFLCVPFLYVCFLSFLSSEFQRHTRRHCGKFIVRFTGDGDDTCIKTYTRDWAELHCISILAVIIIIPIVVATEGLVIMRILGRADVLLADFLSSPTREASLLRAK